MSHRKGFTLVELLIVVTIIGILVAVVIPNFIGVKEKAFDAAAKSDLRNMIEAEENYFIAAQAYVGLAVSTGGFADLDGDGMNDFTASQGISLSVTAYTDGLKVTSRHASSSNTWCMNSSGNATVAGAIVKASSC